VVTRSTGHLRQLFELKKRAAKTFFALSFCIKDSLPNIEDRREEVAGDRIYPGKWSGRVTNSSEKEKKCRYSEDRFF
jgi:hypothetical protein